MKTRDFLNKVCASLNRAPDSLTLDDTMQTVPEWDSLGHLSIIAVMDYVLHVKTTDSDLRGFSSIRELVEALKRRNVLEE
jgi:acyl carrier protein